MAPLPSYIEQGIQSTLCVNGVPIAHTLYHWDLPEQTKRRVNKQMKSWHAER